MKDWPNSTELTAVVFLASLIGALVVGGYVFMVVDFRAYLRSLKRALMVVMQFNPALPAWMQQETPRCLKVFGLSQPCTEADLLKAYRNRVKQLHPDRGGDQRKFMLLQAHFEQAQSILRERAEAE
ncbi:MAG: J domain-containing protein [Pirellulales bacterium]|nr:J domain-containing protein [Pirellulales bacterium]